MSQHVSRRVFLRATGTALGAVFMTACGAAPTPTPTPAPAKPATPTVQPTPAAAASAGKITCLFHGSPAPDNDAYWSPRLKLYRDSHPKVEFVALGSESDEQFVQKISTMVAGGTPPDIAKPSAGRLIATASKGIYEPLEPRIEASTLMQRIWKLLPGQGKEVQFCGKQVAVPMDLVHQLWYYNKDIFDKAGAPYPSIDWTWDDLLTIGAKVTKPADNQYLLIPDVTNFEPYNAWVWQAGGTVFSADCLTTNFAEAPNLTAMQFVVDLFKKSKYAPMPAVKLGDIGVSFDSGKIAMAQGNSPSMTVQLGPKPTWNFKWSAVYGCKGPVSAQSFVKSNGFSVMKKAAAATLGWQFIEWWFSDETMTTLAGWGEAVPRSDIREAVYVKNLPDHLQPAVAKVGTNGRGLERCPGWSAAQTIWKQELDTAISGDVSVKDAMTNTKKKAELEITELMKGMCDLLK